MLKAEIVSPEKAKSIHEKYMPFVIRARSRLYFLPKGKPATNKKSRPQKGTRLYIKEFF